MKYIKSYKIFESINRPIFPKSKEEIIDICNHYNIKYYTINDDLTIDAQFINLEYCALKYLPIKFNKIYRNFIISNNQLVSLEGCPNYVGGQFEFSNNEITSLEYAPKEVGMSLIAANNKITNIDNLPKMGGKCFFNNNSIYNINFHLSTDLNDRNSISIISNPIHYLLLQIRVVINVNENEILDRLQEFEVINHHEIDFISLNSLFDFYNVDYDEDKWIKLLSKYGYKSKY